MATHRGLQLAYPAIVVQQNDKGAKYPGPGPLTLAGWQSVVSEREKDGTLTYPSIRAEMQAHDTLVPASPKGPPAPAAWEEFLDAPPRRTTSEYPVPGRQPVRCRQLPSRHALFNTARPCSLPARIITNLGAISTTAALVLGATLDLTRASQHDALMAAVQRALKPTAAGGHAWFLLDGAPPPSTAAFSAPPPPQLLAGPPSVPQVAHHTAAKPLPGTQPATEPPTVSVVPIQGLGKLDPAEACAALSQLLEVPVYVTHSDIKTGFGFAAITTTVYQAPFATSWTRTYAHYAGWEAIIKGRCDSMGEPFRADTNALSVPPSLRPRERKKVESPQRSTTQAVTAAGVTRKSRKSRKSQERTAPTNTRTSPMWGGRRNSWALAIALASRPSSSLRPALSTLRD